MLQLHLRDQTSVSEEPCALCGRSLSPGPDSQLVRADTGAPVCAECGQAHAPALAALLRLASTAQRISRMSRHGVFPPLAALLDLASAAENYSCAALNSKNDCGLSN